MTLILSQYSDSTTDIVIDWLNYYGHSFIRLNGEDLLKKGAISFSENKFIFKIEGKETESENINSVWFRRAYSSNALYNLNEQKLNKSNLQIFTSHISKEAAAIYRLMECNLSDSYWLNSFTTSFTDKNRYLSIAKNIGLQIPNSYLFSDKSDLSDCLKRKGELIMKPSSDCVAFFSHEKDEAYTMYTEVINSNFLRDIPPTFFPTFFQEKVEKKYEVRAFFLEGKIYSMAIFSQLDSKTSIDFRHYNEETPNRLCPYKLPKAIEAKIKILMRQLSLNCGSLDFILSKNGDYIFLEVNPVGQFGWLSYICNYNIYEEVAKNLIKKDNDYGIKKIRDRK